MMQYPRLILFVCAAVSASAAGKVDFARDIRPILSDRCFSCHGPDPSNRMVNLRLDTEEGARKARGKHTPIVPGDPAASEVYRRITAVNDARRMPPAASVHKRLNEREVALVRAWIEQGALWQSHWAFNAPRRAPLPPVRDSRWVRNPIDSFVLARMEKENLKPSPEADRARLIRRVTLDITGLPPTPAEVQAFVAGQSEGAYEKLVDRLLASPRYGERMAVDWLDAARYADTHGFQVDPQKEMWAWRDWVIGAFNRNEPFDQFTIDQIAGDMLPGATLAQRIATGFQRNHRINTEAGSIAEEFHAENLVDRVSTMGAVWLGLTVGCARCHDHKYDPLTMREFYSLTAFFNNVEEVGTGGTRDGRGNAAPQLRLPAPELEPLLAAKEAELRKARERLREVEKTLEPGMAQWEQSARDIQPKWEPLSLVSVASEGGVTLTAQPDGSILASGKHPARDIVTLAADTKLTNITGFRFELIPDASFPGGGSGRGENGKGVLTNFDVKMTPLDKSGKSSKVEFARVSA
ncbi:MAG: DUF1549 domain-containing protein, partial [Bryobacteraceae bacterium]